MIVIRFAVLVLAVLAACLAIVQGAGRVIITSLGDYEDFLNQQLAPAELSGTEGFWNGINPGVRLARLTLPFGEFTGIVFELDTVETLLHNHIVARVLKFDDAKVAMERTPDGWRLLNQQAQPAEFDFETFATYSDIIMGRVRVMLHDGEAVDAFTVEGRAVNRQGRHRFSVSVTTPDSCTDCGIVAQGNIAEFLDRSPERGNPSFATITVKDFVLRIAQLGDVPLQFNGDAAWYRGDDEGNGRARLEFVDAHGEMFSVVGGLWQHDDGYRGRLGMAHSKDGDSLPSNPDGPFVGFLIDGEGIKAWLSRIDLKPLLATVRSNIDDDAPNSEWLDNLRIGGVVEDVRVLWDGRDSTVAASVRDLTINAHRGVPMVRAGNGTVVGRGGAFLVEVADAPLTMAFPELFEDAWSLERASGTIEAWVEPGYLGLRGHGLVGVMADTRSEIGFAFARPNDLYEVRVALDAVVERTTVATARTLIPVTLGSDIRNWLLQSIKGGDLDDARMVYSGYGRARPGEALNQIELAGSVRNGTIQYHPDWPSAFDVRGRFAVTTKGIFATGSARVFDANLSAIRVELPLGSQTVGIKLKARADAARVIEFGRIEPLRQALYFMDPSWSGEGSVGIDADLDIPFVQGEDGTRPEGRYDVVFHFDATRLHLVDWALDFRELNGSVQYRSPATINGSAITGSLFDHPVRVDVATAERIVFDVEGTIGAGDVYMLMGSEDLGIARGSTDFRARALFGGGHRPTLEINDDLRGIELLLPPPLDKAPDASVDFRTSIEFFDDFASASVHLGDAHGWMDLADARILRGAMGLGASTPVSDENSNRVAVSGRLNALDLASTLEQETTSNWQFNELVIDRIHVGEFSIDAAVIDGFVDLDEARIQITASEMDGVISRAGEAPWQITLSEVRIPEESWDEDKGGDPLSVDMMASWVDADVVVERILLGTEDYGSWRFSLRSSTTGAAFRNLTGELKGLRIQSQRPIFWDAAANETYFLGYMNSSDVARVLREWDYAANVESRSLEACGDLRWPGSPVNFALSHSSGHVAVRLDEGRFPTADQGLGPMRILSLINFSAVTKRMGFDFSDVVGEGVSFEHLTADLSVDDGVVRFLEPMEIIGTGSHFYIVGTVDMDTTALDLRMVVTLPLHRSLPWYAAYLALATPTSAVGVLGVLVGEQLFGDQFEQLTSGMYRIGGTYENPEVVFQEIFTNDMDVPNTIASEGYPGAGGCSLDRLTPPENISEQTMPDVPPTNGQLQAAQEPSTPEEAETTHAPNELEASEGLEVPEEPQPSEESAGPIPESKDEPEPEPGDEPGDEPEQEQAPESKDEEQPEAKQ